MPKQDHSTLVSQLVQYTDTEIGSQYYRYIGNIGNKVNRSIKTHIKRQIVHRYRNRILVPQIASQTSIQIPKQDLVLDIQVIRQKLMHKQNKFTRQKTSKILGNFYFKTLVTKTVIYTNTYTHKHT